MDSIFEDIMLFLFFGYIFFFVVKIWRRVEKIENGPVLGGKNE